MSLKAAVTEAHAQNVEFDAQTELSHHPTADVIVSLRAEDGTDRLVF